MNLKIKWTIALATSMYFLAACNNSSTTAANGKDTSISQNSNAARDTTTKMDDKRMDNSLMSSTNVMMEKMQGIKMTGDFDIDFASGMIEHHQGAIDMSEQELKSGKDDSLRNMAQRIITAQKEEIAQLQAFLKNYKPSGMKHGEGELEKSMADMSGKMKSTSMTGDVDKDFATMMIAHHQSAVSMANLEIKNGMSNKLKQMSQKMVKDQTKEIGEFKAWLKNK
jgi:uncharacterized protein (DUF305 family)